MIAITSGADALAGRARARGFLEERSLSPEQLAEVAIVVAELAANLWRHGGGGTLRLSDADEGNGRAVLIEATDNGPGLPAHAFEDGYSTGSGLGGGLGAVRRFTDRIEVETREGYTRIRAWKRIGSTSA